MAFNEVILWVIVALFVIDPPSRKEKRLSSAAKAEPATEAGLNEILTAMTHFDIFFPLIQKFVTVINFCLFGINIAPVAASMLDWTPVNISTLSAVGSGFTFVGMAITLYLSMIKTTDFTMVVVGNGSFMIAGAMTYFNWRDHSIGI